ncbi:MAG TPA: Uma2 family endonuclease [Longimicrobiales bacterium]|nr:Uma2 family endonuclease [Longimicrobiales bacterium]
MTTRERNAPDRLTLAEFEALPPPGTERWELSAGLLVREPLPGNAHGAVVANITAALHAWAAGAGGMVVAESGFVLSADEREDGPTVRGPDVAWVAPDRAGYGVPEGFFRGAPDLAVEVVSPSNSAADIQEKVLQYMEAGSRQVWVAYPRTRTLVVHERGASARILGAAQTLEGGDLLPGFSVPVADLFPL